MNNNGTLIANKYVVRRTNKYQLILELVGYIGSLHKLDELYTENSYFAIVECCNNGHTEVNLKVGEQLGKDKSKTVVVTKKNESNFDFKPYKISIFFNYAYVKLEVEDYFLKPETDEIIIEWRNKSQRNYYLVTKSAESSKYTEVKQLIIDEQFADMQGVYWIDESHVYHSGERVTFTTRWARKMKKELNKISDNTKKIYPTFEGDWVTSRKNTQKKVLPIELYSKKAKKINKDFWMEYLKEFKNVAVAYTSEFPKGKVIG